MFTIASAVRALVVLSFATTLLTGCGTDRVAAENDRLRRRVMELEDEVDRVTQREAELMAELRAAAGAPDSVREAVRAATPHVASLSIGRLSHARDDDGDGRVDSLVIYLEPVDGRGRSLQIVGDVWVNAALLPTDRDAVTIARTHLDPIALRETYRSGFGGPHYTIVAAIDPARAAEVGQAGTVGDRCTIRAVFTDGRTGRTIEADRSIQLRPPKSRVPAP